MPTLLSGVEAKGAYDRLAAAKFREHRCEAAASHFATQPDAQREAASAFAERVRTLIKRGYKPKDAVALLLQETEIEHGNNPRMMERARAEAEDFLQKIRKGLV